MHIEHINPKSGDSGDNRLACPNSLSKVTRRLDNVTDDVVTLFNPRFSEWAEIFSGRKVDCFFVEKLDW